MLRRGSPMIWFQYAPLHLLTQAYRRRRTRWRSACALDPETELDSRTGARAQEISPGQPSLNGSALAAKIERHCGMIAACSPAPDFVRVAGIARACAGKDPTEPHARLRLPMPAPPGRSGALRRAPSTPFKRDPTRRHPRRHRVVREHGAYAIWSGWGKIIAEFEAKQQEPPGTAARILDYSAIWIHADGSARMLEHEIIRIQSRKASRSMPSKGCPMAWC